jgi:putative glutamine amidotransferase
VPTLAICRGHQLVNVALGGHLHQHVEGHEGTDRPSTGFHPVTIAGGSRLASALGGGTTLVNSLHHQAVDLPGHGLIVSARAADGTVEATEHPAHPLITVQWHPERQGDSDAYRLLVNWLLAAAVT